MTVRELCEKAGLTPMVMPAPDREVEGGYAGDLLSWVMGNAFAGCAWVTIMTNRNIIAVATLIEMACVILAEGCELDDEVLALAEAQGVNVLNSPLGAYEICVELSKVL